MDQPAPVYEAIRHCEHVRVQAEASQHAEQERTIKKQQDKLAQIKKGPR